MSEAKTGRYEPLVSGDGFGELSAVTRPAFPPKPAPYAGPSEELKQVTRDYITATTEPRPAKTRPTTPIEDAVNYVNNKWFQQLIPVRTACYRCGKQSPMVHVPHGTLAFGDTRIVRRNDRDVTDEVISAFADIRWKFQKHRAYCPDCKDLGSV